MKISLGERSTLQTILDNCIQWELDACSLLNDTECLLNVNDIRDGSSAGLVSKIERQVASLECVTKSDLCLHFDFVDTSKLKDACSTLQWCLKALSFCDVAPVIEVMDCLFMAYHVESVFLSIYRDTCNYNFTPNLLFQNVLFMFWKARFLFLIGSWDVIGGWQAPSWYIRIL